VKNYIRTYRYALFLDYENFALERDLNCYIDFFRPDSTSDKTSASGAGGMRIGSRADQISYTLPITRRRCNLDSGATCGDGHRSIVTTEKLLSE